MIIVYILILIFGISIGAIIVNSLHGCKHHWKLIESNKVFRIDKHGRENHTGYIKFYECEYCKKLKKEQIELD